MLNASEIVQQGVVHQTQCADGIVMENDTAFVDGSFVIEGVTISGFVSDCAGAVVSLEFVGATLLSTGSDGLNQTARVLGQISAVVGSDGIATAKFAYAGLVQLNQLHSTTITVVSQ